MKWPDPLRVLHIEDNPADRELVRLLLLRNGVTCELTHAGTLGEVRQILQKGAHDVILADFTLPDGDGLAVLALARELAPDVPFLFVSGTIGEERAIEAMKGGATDYVSKERLDRLLPALRGALRESGERARRRESEAALRKSEEQLREMAENIRDVFWVTTPDGKELLYVSPAYETIWGRPVASLFADPTSWLDPVVESDRPLVQAALAGLALGEEYRIEYRIRRPDGAERWIEDRGYAIRGPSGRVERTLGSASDITHRKLLEAELRQSQKMESIGQMAGGIAHDFNNVLTVINNQVHLLLDGEDLSPEAMQSLREVYAAGEHAARLTRQLQLFSRKQAFEPRLLDLAELVRETARMLQRLLGADIRFHLELPAGPVLVMGDAGMIEQVLVNLTVNARDAMPAGGSLHIRCQATEPAASAGAPSKDSVGFACLHVEDTGTGIATEILPRIFEPFFTTKEAGKGSGLGLATVYAIVQQHQGRVEVDSRVGAGSLFRVFLPLARAEVKDLPAKVTVPEAGGGSETILLVEDEASVRQVAAAVLRRLGYRVLQAASGKEALEVWKWHSARIRLLLTDVVMPEEISGVALAQLLWAENPELKVVFCSGYSEAVDGDQIPEGARFECLPKPYQPKTLAKAVRDALDT